MCDPQETGLHKYQELHVASQGSMQYMFTMVSPRVNKSPPILAFPDPLIGSFREHRTIV